MTSSQNRAGEPLELCGGPLGKLCFQWAGDRYHHEWRFDDTASLRSIESDHSDAWPASPPLQQIHQQSFADGREVVFGVGMSGRGHWSASFTLIGDLNCWIIELACRSSVAPDSLLSTYSSPGHWFETEAGHLACHDGAATPLEIEAIAPSAQAAIADGNLLISPTEILSGSATTQWAFRLRTTTN